MTACHFDPDAGDYLTPEGEPCKRDEAHVNGAVSAERAAAVLGCHRSAVRPLNRKTETWEAK